MLDLFATIAGDMTWILILVYVRVQACILALPGLGGQTISIRVKVALAMALTPLLAGPFPPASLPGSPLGIGAGIIMEMVLGFASGMFLRLLAGAIGIATTAMATSSSLSQLVGVQTEDAPHPLGRIFHYGGMAVLMALGFPVMVVELMFDGLNLWPPGGFPDVAGLGKEAVKIMSTSFVLAMMIAAPFTLGGFLYQALSGAINRVMPSLPVVFIGAPASILLALCAAALLAPLLIEVWANTVLDFTLPRE